MCSSSWGKNCIIQQNIKIFKKTKKVHLVTAYCESGPMTVNWTLENTWRNWTCFRLQYDISVYRQLEVFPLRVLWKMFMGMHAGILETIKRDVKRNVSGELHTTDCYCLQDRNLSSVKVHNFSSIKTTSIHFFSSFLISTMTNKCTIISQITTLVNFSTLSCHPQGARK